MSFSLILELLMQEYIYCFCRGGSCQYTTCGRSPHENVKEKRISKTEYFIKVF